MKLHNIANNKEKNKETTDEWDQEVEDQCYGGPSCGRFPVVFCVGYVLWKQKKLSVKHGFHGYWVWLTKGEDFDILLHDRHMATHIHNFSRESCTDVTIWRLRRSSENGNKRCFNVIG